MMKNFSFVLILVLCFAVTSGCATKGFVRTELEGVRIEMQNGDRRTLESANEHADAVAADLQEQINGLGTGVGEVRGEISRLDGRIDGLEVRTDKAEKTSQELQAQIGDQNARIFCENWTSKCNAPLSFNELKAKNPETSILSLIQSGRVQIAQLWGARNELRSRLAAVAACSGCDSCEDLAKGKAKHDEAAKCGSISDPAKKTECEEKIQEDLEKELEKCKCEAEKKKDPCK